MAQYDDHIVGGPLPVNPWINGRAAVITHAELPTPRDLAELGLTRINTYQPLKSRWRGRCELHDGVDITLLREQGEGDGDGHGPH